MEAGCKVSDFYSTGLEKTITVVRGNASLGMTVGALRDGSGISIRSMAYGGAISKDGRLKVGDGILALNGEATTNCTTAQARAMLRRHSLIGPELSVTCVPAAFLDIHRAIRSKQASRATVIQSKQELKLNQATVIQSKNNPKLDQAIVIQSKERMNLGQETVIQSKQETILGHATAIQSKQETIPGYATAIQSKQKTILGHSTITQSKQEMIPGYATVIQSKQETIPGHATIIQSKQETIPGHATIIQSKQETIPGYATVTQSKQEMIPGHATAIQSKQEMGRSTAAQFRELKGFHKTFTKLERIPEQGREEERGGGGGRATEKTCQEREEARRRGDNGERKDKEKKGSGDGDPFLPVQAKEWRKDETEEKRQRRDHESWSRPRRVTLTRTNGESLGISVIGGRGMGCRLSNGQMRRGIFIKHISVNSRAARDDTLTAGDRILQVGGVDVSDFTHEEAVEAIRQAGDKVELLVQSSQLLRTGLLKSPPPHPAPPPPRLSSDSVSPLTDGVTSKPAVERLHGPSERRQHCQQGQEPYWGPMLQKCGGLPGERKLVEPDCSTHTSGLGMWTPERRVRGRTGYESELQRGGAAAAKTTAAKTTAAKTTAAKTTTTKTTEPTTTATTTATTATATTTTDKQIKGPVLHAQGFQNAAAAINSASSKVQLALNRNKAALKHGAPGSGIAEERMRLDKRQACPSNGQTTNPHQTRSHRSSSISPAGSGPRPCPPHYSACGVRSDPLTRPIVPGCVNIVDICKGHSSLGLTVVGGCDTSLGNILIHEVNEGGAAHRDGRLRAGDHLLEVNGIDLRTALHEEALSVLRLSPQHVRLCVYRHTSPPPPHPHPHEDMWDLFTVDLQLQPGQELGLSIVGKRNNAGMFVSEIRRGGLVESDARLALGDQILSVDGQDLRAVTQDHACSLLQKCSGSVTLEVARFRAHPRYSYQCQFNLPDWW